jgi:hypothetical protein
MALVRSAAHNTPRGRTGPQVGQVLHMRPEGTGQSLLSLIAHGSASCFHFSLSTLRVSVCVCYVRTKQRLVLHVQLTVAPPCLNHFDEWYSSEVRLANPSSIWTRDRSKLAAGVTGRATMSQSLSKPRSSSRQWVNLLVEFIGTEDEELLKKRSFMACSM